MDISKLPKLSHSEPPPPTPAEVESPRPPTSPVSAAGADIWISLIVGLLLIAVGLTFLKFLIAKATGQPFHTGVNWVEGSGHPATEEVAYFDLEGYTAWTDAGIFIFGVVLLVDAAVLATTLIRPGRFSRILLPLALLLTLSGTILNVIVSGLLLHVGIVPLYSGIAVAIGGYLAWSQWQILRGR